MFNGIRTFKRLILRTAQEYHVQLKSTHVLVRCGSDSEHARTFLLEHLFSCFTIMMVGSRGVSTLSLLESLHFEEAADDI